MIKEDFIESGVYNGHMYNIGCDDCGQCYYIEYLDENGKLIETSCGTYNLDYQGVLEYLFGDPEKNCEYFNNIKTDDCLYLFKYGFCSQCKYFKNVFQKE